MKTDCILNKTVDMLSAGTRVTIMEGPHHDGSYTVQMRTPPSHKLIDSGVPYGGIFDCDAEDLTELRPRSENVVPSQRAKKREAKRKAYADGHSNTLGA